MSAPHTHTKILPFNQRVERVAAEISKRLANTSAKQKPALQACLWVRWLNREVL